jgi:mRNA interferase RelE/StbE
VNNEPWRVIVAGPAARDIEALPEKYALAVIEALRAIAADPRRLGKPLRFELEGKWAARRGPYRVIYSIDDKTRTVSVLVVAHRADAYRPSP